LRSHRRRALSSAVTIGLVGAIIIVSSIAAALTLNPPSVSLPSKQTGTAQNSNLDSSTSYSAATYLQNSTSSFSSEELHSTTSQDTSSSATSSTQSYNESTTSPMTVITESSLENTQASITTTATSASSTFTYNATTRIENGIWQVVSSPAPAGCQAAFDPTNGNMYMTEGGVVSVVNNSGPGIVSSFKAGKFPCAITYDAQDNRLYVAASDSVVEIDPDHQSIVGTVNLTSSISAIMYDPANGYIYASNGTATIIDPSTNSIVSSIQVGSDPEAFAYDSLNHDVYVANGGSNDVSVINSSLFVVATIPVPTSPSAITYDLKNNEVYVSILNGVSIVNTTTNQIAEVLPNGAPAPGGGIVLDPDTNLMFIGGAASGNAEVVIVLNATDNLFLSPIAVHGMPEVVGFNPSDHEIYVGSFDNTGNWQTEISMI
jgi:YVTN family beta-propeller protein